MQQQSVDEVVVDDVVVDDVVIDDVVFDDVVVDDVGFENVVVDDEGDTVGGLPDFKVEKVVNTVGRPRGKASLVSYKTPT